MLLDRRLLEILAKDLDIGRDMQRLDIGDLADLVIIAPGEEPTARPIIGHAGILVPDRRGEEFQEPARRPIAGGGDDARHQQAVASGDDQGLGLDDDDGLAHAS